MTSGFLYIWHPFSSMFLALKFPRRWCEWHMHHGRHGAIYFKEVDVSEMLIWKHSAAACVLFWPEPPEARSCQHVIVYFLSGNKILFCQKERTKKREKKHPKRNKSFLSTVFHMWFIGVFFQVNPNKASEWLWIKIWFSYVEQEPSGWKWEVLDSCLYCFMWDF